MTYVVHHFMDAADVAPAWRLMQADQVASDLVVRATQERLSACTYAMAHPETDELVPACVQHAVLDPGENAQLRGLLPLTVVGSRSPGTSRTSAQTGGLSPARTSPGGVRAT